MCPSVLALIQQATWSIQTKLGPISQWVSGVVSERKKRDCPVSDCPVCGEQWRAVESSGEQWRAVESSGEQ